MAPKRLVNGPSYILNQGRLTKAPLATLRAQPTRPPMTDLSRRNIIGAAAGGVVVAAASAPEALAAGAQPPSGPAPRPLAGKELPSFRFRLGAQPVKNYDGGWAKEATVAEFPVSEKLAG